jgi:hypothetical protein
MTEDKRYTRDGVADLLRRLAKEAEKGAKGWENTTVDTFVDALAACLRSSGGYYHNNFGKEIPDNAWQVIYDALEAAKTYE